MVKDGQRLCGICGAEIQPADQCVVLTVPKDKAAPFLVLAENDPDVAGRIL